MAEGGEENPFSFKKFVGKKAVGDDSDDSDSEHKEVSQVFDLLDTLSRQHQEKVDDGDQRNRRKEDDNPFSFKKFLQTDVKRNPSAQANLSTFDLANDLPDFVQDHYNTAERPRHSVPDAPLPDFTLGLLDDNSPVSGVSLGKLRDSPFAEHPEEVLPDLSSGRHSVDDLQSSPSLAISDFEDDQMGNCLDGDKDSGGLFLGRHSTGGLPDFLSDSAIGGGAIPKKSVPQNGYEFPPVNGVSSLNTNEELRMEVQRLQTENQLLREQLLTARDNADREARRVEKVQSDMATVRQRELEETAALENMVQQVEANLQTTMARAVKAESTITKLKQEVATLKLQVQSLSEEKNILLQQGVSETVRDKTKYAAEQLSTAAKTAESNLKQLLRGVDTLKLVSDILASVETITNEPSSSQSPPESPDKKS